MSTVWAPPLTSTVCTGIVPTAAGARFGCGLTFAVKVWVALNPPGSTAITVIVALPAVPGVTVTTAPDTLTVTTPALAELAM